MVISLARYIWLILKIPSEREVDPILSKLILGLVAFLATNGVVYVIAHQVFGDPFVLIILGFFLGFVMATPKIIQREDIRRGTCDPKQVLNFPSAFVERRCNPEGQRRESQFKNQPRRDEEPSHHGPGDSLNPVLGRSLP